MSSREVKEPSLYQLTKKERVIYLAQKDPFLKVEKIAQLAETTSHYVRTVLSEADLSLTKLREDYARKNKVDSYSKNELILDLLNLNQLEGIKSKQQKEIILNHDYQFDVQGQNNIAETLLFISQNQPVFISSLFFSSNHNLSNVEDLKKLEDVSISTVEISVKNCNQELAELLKSDISSPIIVLEKEIYLANKFQGINVVYLLAAEFKLILDEVLEKIKIIRN